MGNKFALGGFIILIGVVLLGIAGFAVLKKQPAPIVIAPQPQAATTTIPALQTYLNAKYDYLLKYPNSWLGGEVSENINSAAFYKEKGPASGTTPNLIVEVFENPKGLSAEAWWTGQHKDDASEYMSNGQLQIPAWYTGYKYKHVGGAGDNHLVFNYVFRNENRIFHIFGTPDDGTFNKIIADFRPMVRYSFPSLDGRYAFNIYSPHDGMFCGYRVLDSNGLVYDVEGIVGAFNLGCQIGDDFKSNFIGWADGDRFLLRSTPGEVKIVNAKNLTAETRQYDANNYYFDAANRSLKYWLFQHDEGGGDYTILDGNNSIVVANLKGYRYALYDPVNDGFVFMAGDQVGTAISLRVDYLSLSDLKLRNVLKTDPVEPPGRGCGGPSLSSKPGELIIGPGCIFVAPKYFSSDIGIHIKLNE